MESAEAPLLGRRVLVGAYACDPSRGSEPGVGWHLLRGWLALGASVVVVTRKKSVEALRESFAEEVHAERLQVIGHDLSPLLTQLKKRLPGGVQFYYALWQHSVARLVTNLHRNEPFHIAHHATFAADWMPSAMTPLGRMGLPVIWGPVGGASPYLASQMRELDGREKVAELVRLLTGWVGRQVFGKPAARAAALVVAQNHDVERVFRSAAKDVLCEPNVFVDRSLVMPRDEGESKSIVGVGRLLGFKGWRLAVRALSLMPREYDLTIFGEGPGRGPLEREIQRLGLGRRVKLEGWRDRTVIMAAISKAHCLVHPSFHEAAGMSVGEALRAGCPVVVLDVGGPRILVSEAGGIAVDPQLPNLEQRLADALEKPEAPSDRYRWGSERVPDLLLDWHARACRSVTSAEQVETSVER